MRNKQQKLCTCQEARIPGGEAIRMPRDKPLAPVPGWERAHNCEYIAERMALIPSAIRLANQRYEVAIPKPPLDQLFHEAMDELYRQRHKN